MKIFLLVFISLLFSIPTNAEEDLLKNLAKHTTRSTTPIKQTEKKAARWWQRRHKEKLEQKKELGDVQLVFLGDSITHAWDKYQDPWKKYFGKYNPLNLGFSGDRTEHVLWRLDNDAVEDINPKVLVLMIGTNNAGYHQEASKYTALGIKAILQELHFILPDTKILLLAIFPRGVDDNDKLRRLNMQTNKIIESYADNEKIHFMNINNIFLDDNRILHKSVMRDRLHPGKEMYPKWAEAITPKINELMQK